MTKLHLNFMDRIGIVADISSAIARHGLSIAAMEVVQRDGCAHVYLDIDHGGTGQGRQEVLALLAGCPGLQEIHCVDALPREKQANLLRVVLDTVDESILAIDAAGCVTVVNEVARRSLGLAVGEIVGRRVQDLPLADQAILDCLAGRRYDNVRKCTADGRKRRQYFATGRPLLDAAGGVAGAVEIAKDAQEIRNLARAMVDPDRVEFADIVGTSPSLRQVLAMAEKIAATSAIVTIRGESGTGKDLLAQAIHAASGRPGRFVAINCAAVPEGLLESELFGYAGGAFSGARKEGRAGLFEMARDGTVFLDEIGEMPLSAQAKVLRLIQSSRVRRLGGDRETSVDARIVTATNRNLEELVERRLFREDLYYRINVLPLTIPPLRERPEDVLPLAEHFLFQFSARLGKAVLAFDGPARDRLVVHGWPGNVRELKNVVERAAILCESSLIGADHVLLGHGLGRLSAAGERGVPPGAGGASLRETLDRYEAGILTAALAGGTSIRRAARGLGLSHTALRNRLRRLGLAR